jgi:hypothetical protein
VRSSRDWHALASSAVIAKIRIFGDVALAV